MTDHALDAFTVTLSWTWALALAASDAERVVEWKAATMRALGVEFDETASLVALDEKSTQ